MNEKKGKGSFFRLCILVLTAGIGAFMIGKSLFGRRHDDEDSK